MDGTNAAFLFESPSFSACGDAPAGGILYIEDFDADLAPGTAAAAPEPAAPSYTAEELSAAYAAGREAGLAAALADEQLVQAQLHLAATQSLGDGLTAARDMLDSLARDAAGDLTRTILSALQAAVPTVMRDCAKAELHAMLETVIPSLRFQPELRVHAHPTMAESIRETIITLLPAETCVLSVCTDETLAAGDIRITWQDGHAKRDSNVVWASICAALGHLRLPTLEEICHGCGR